MNTAMLKIRLPSETGAEERPGWIPREITENWDRDPYAYQTEEELMPAGGLHGYLVAYFVEILRSFLETRGLMLLADTFMLYRDGQGVKQRISPDLLLMPFRFPPPSAYNLDIEPPPVLVMEITSPKSRMRDMKNKVFFYTGLGIRTYFVIDAVTSGAKLRKETGLHLWRKNRSMVQEIQPDTAGYLTLPEIGIKVKADGHRLIFADTVSGEMLHDTGELKAMVLKEQQRADRERLRADRERLRAEEELLRADRERLRAEAAEKKAEQAQKQGGYNKAEETARKMLVKKYSPAEISELTGLSADEIRGLIEK
jgi:Uma2 family endonuclease